jgi:branched-subunit amino acid transport protein
VPNDLTAWTAILLVAALTFASRLIGALLMSRVDASPSLERFLDGLSVSVIAALVASILAQGGLREASAVGIAALIMFKSKSAVWAMIVGMTVASMWLLLPFAA